MKIIKKIMMITPLMLSFTAMVPISSCAISTNSTKSTNILDSSVASSETHIEDIKVKNKDQLTSLQVGKQAQIQTEILPENALVKNITYESLNEDIVTVTPDGIINAHKQGSTKIYVKAKILNVKDKSKWWPNVVSVYSELYVNVFTEGVNIKFIDGGNGTVSSSALIAQKGSTLSEIINNYNLKCIPDEGYIFDCWVDENNNPINIDSQIANEITIKAMFKKATFENDSWENIIKYAEQGLDTLKKVYSTDTFQGYTREVIINNRIHTVKVIDENHDVCTNSGNKAALTFQLTTLLSDANGNAMETKWDTGKNYNYTQGYLKGNLTGNGGKRSWDTTVWDMLPSDLRKGIKKVDKTVWEWDSERENGHFVNYSDSLFALTCTEYGQTNKYEEYHTEGTPYKYWVDHNNADARRFYDANGTNKSYWLASPCTVELIAFYVGPYRHADEVNDAWSMPNFDAYSHQNVETSNAISFGFCI